MESELNERAVFRISRYKDRDKDRIFDTLSGLPGVRDVSVDSGAVEVTYDPTEIGVPKLESALLSAGFHLETDSSSSPVGVAGESNAP